MAPVTTRTIPMQTPAAGGVAPAWPPLVAVRVVEEMFADVAPDTLDAIRMAAGELAENVVKFGEDVGGVAGQVVISRTDDSVEIRTANRLGDATRAQKLAERLGRIGDAESAKTQFVERIAEIIQEPEHTTTALGLLRIVYEGLFELSCTYADATMTVVAARSIR